MENINDTVKIIQETIADYVELFHTQKDIETAIQEDMGVMNYPYELKWIDTGEKQGNEPVYKLDIQIKIEGSFFFMEFYYWD